ncbi:MAG: carbohydrate porin [Phycisphaerae bacterium]|nr:carbohydrate porin [Phycisphaerae bacterium]
MILKLTPLLFISAMLMFTSAWARSQTVPTTQASPTADQTRSFHEKTSSISGICNEPVADDLEPDPSDYLTGNWGGVRDQMVDSGIIVNLDLYSVYQVNAHGGQDTQDAQRITGEYNLHIGLDLEKLLKLKGSYFYVRGRGGFGNGLDGTDKIGDIFGVNGNTVGYRSMDVVEAWFHQNFFDGKLQFRLGKIDMSGTIDCRGCPLSIDGNAYANDAQTQFLNNALVNNPTIPFPDYGLGVMVYYSPVEWFYTTAGVADAQADYRKTGFSTTFHDEDHFVSMYEFGFTPAILTKKGPLTGNYRFGLWYDPRPKEMYFNDYNGRLPARLKRDDVGFYASFDQKVYHENDWDDQGLGLFFRYGYAHSDANFLEHFWSIGGAYQGLIPTRDEDVLGLGFAQGFMTNDLGYYEGFNPGRETVFELYYAVKVTHWLTLSPDIQYIMDPGANHDGRDTTVLGIRLGMQF